MESNKKHKIFTLIFPILILLLQLVIAYGEGSQVNLAGYVINRTLITLFLGFVMVAWMGFYTFFFFRWCISGIIFWITSLVILADVVKIALHT